MCIERTAATLQVDRENTRAAYERARHRLITASKCIIISSLNIADDPKGIRVRKDDLNDLKDALLEMDVRSNQLRELGVI